MADDGRLGAISGAEEEKEENNNRDYYLFYRQTANGWTDRWTFGVCGHDESPFYKNF